MIKTGVHDLDTFFKLFLPRPLNIFKVSLKVIWSFKGDGKPARLLILTGDSPTTISLHSITHLTKELVLLTTIVLPCKSGSLKGKVDDDALLDVGMVGWELHRGASFVFLAKQIPKNTTNCSTLSNISCCVRLFNKFVKSLPATTDCIKFDLGEFWPCK